MRIPSSVTAHYASSDDAHAAPYPWLYAAPYGAPYPWLYAAAPAGVQSAGARHYPHYEGAMRGTPGYHEGPTAPPDMPKAVAAAVAAARAERFGFAGP